MTPVCDGLAEPLQSARHELYCDPLQLVATDDPGTFLGRLPDTGGVGGPIYTTPSGKMTASPIQA